MSLTDGEGRGTGRLVLILKPMPTRVTAEWMAQQWRAGRRTKSKIGSYPTVSLSDAREIFKRDFADTILKGSSIKIAADARPGTVADLFDAYVKNLKESGKTSWPKVENCLNMIVDTLGGNRLARDVAPDDVLGVLRPIYKRGKRALADHVRSYIRSAFSWASNRSVITAPARPAGSG
jgi:integrase